MSQDEHGNIAIVLQMKTARHQKIMNRTLLAALLALAAIRPAAGAEADAGAAIGLKLVAEGFGAPCALAALPDGSGRLLVAEQAGVIQLLD